MSSPIANRVIESIAHHLGLKQENVLPGMSIVDDLDADSLDQVEIVMAVEDDFEIEVSDEEAEKCKTVQDAIDLVTKIVRGEVPQPQIESQLPLPAHEDRCLGHPQGTHEASCTIRDMCCRHATISHKDEPWDKTKPPFYTLAKDNVCTHYIKVVK